MTLVPVGHLPDDPLSAAAQFYADFMPRIAPVGAVLTLVFGPADYTHRAWRLAAVQGVARRWAPVRINAVASASGVAILAADTYLCNASGVTGQYLPLADMTPT